jgi:hypothetical protein
MLAERTNAPAWTSTGARDQHALLDHFIRPQQDGLRNGQPECLRNLEVDHQLEFGRLLDGEICWFCPLQNLDVISTLASCPA